MSANRGSLRSRRLSNQWLACALSVAVFGWLGSFAHATMFFEDGFDYPAGNLGGNGSWTTASSNITVTSGSLTYPNLQDAAAPGSEVTVTSGVAAGSTPANFTGTAVTSGSVFYSFVAQCTTLPTANNYLTSLLPSGATGPNGGTDPLAFYVGQQTAGSTYKVGIRHQGIGSGATYAASNATLTANSTHFFVVQYTFNPSTADDVISLYVDPVPGDPQPAAAVTLTGATGVDAANLQEIGFKAQSANTAGNWIFDTVRVGDTWADVTPAVPEPATGALLVVAAVGALARRGRRMA